ncbi:MAG TPA: ACP S-malonyltransferase [Oligoflexia bacterium]|nr:ACP S-malonyltransferase [Oligoflexia bacterium]HMP27542.1 ACP S-malonyltransferase [Oligoflexia bacterium]
MTKEILALFPGQGSQFVGMGKELIAKSSLAQEHFEIADERLGFKLSSLCFNGPLEELTLTANAQPAILTVSVIAYRLAQKDGGERPVAAAGHSLGEYSALVAAGALDFADAVELVRKRGEYMQNAVSAGSGSMLAVLGKEIEEIKEKLKELDDLLEIANINAPGQIVLSGRKSAAEKFKQIAAGWKVIELNVSAPFHCSLMKPAADSLKKDLDKVEIKPPLFPVIANFLARPLTDPTEIREALCNQVCGAVRWTESMEVAIKTFAITYAVEYGPGAVLNGLLKRINSKIERINVC